MTLDTSTFSPGAEAVYLVVSPSKGGYLRRQRWLLALLGGFLTLLIVAVKTLTGVLYPASNLHQFHQKVCQKARFLSKIVDEAAYHFGIDGLVSCICFRRISTAGGTVP